MAYKDPNYFKNYYFLFYYTGKCNYSFTMDRLGIFNDICFNVDLCFLHWKR